MNFGDRWDIIFGDVHFVVAFCTVGLFWVRASHAGFCHNSVTSVFVEYVISIPCEGISILAFEGKCDIFLVLGKLREYIQDLKRKILMKIVILRHGKVDMQWPRLCDSKGFDKACTDYDSADIVHSKADNCMGNIEKVYISNQDRSMKTAEMIFGKKKFIQMDNICEVPLRSFADLNLRLPLWIWNVIGRLQWYSESGRQPEGRKRTIERAEQVICELENGREDCVLVTHGFFMKSLVKQLKKQGYHVQGNKMLGFENLQIIVAEKMEI